jgi:DNA invertase Pin-like site-specific DNA recombinase
MARRRKKQRNEKAVIGYVRVSTDDQKLGSEAQKAALNAWCEARGFDLKGVYVDEGVSGGAEIEKRPGLLEAIDALDHFNAGIVLATKRDRIARDVLKAGFIEKLVEDEDARIVTTDGVGEDESPEASLMKQILDAFAEYERARIRLRTVRALRVKQKKGELTGKPPIGTKVSKNGKRLNINPTEMMAVFAIKQLHKSKHSLRSICTELDRMALPARGKRWYPTTVMRIIERFEDENQTVLNTAMERGIVNG